MTPNNIAGMATLAGLNIVALTDHNTAKNCPAFFAAAKRNGIIPVAGMELSTAEDIHVVCLFPELENAMDFDLFIQSHRSLIKNRADIFGNQLILDEHDSIIDTDEYLLLNATDIPIEDVSGYVEKFDGICYPAHIDREANGAIATLGDFPDCEGFKCCEFYDRDKVDDYCERYPSIKSRKQLVSSDAHYLWDIRDKENYIILEDDPYSSDFVRRNLFDYLRG